MSTERHQIVKNSFHYLSATTVAQAVGMIRSVIMPVLLGPAQLGIWNLMAVVLSYAGNAHLGLLHGMNKLIPTLRGQGEMDEVETVKNSAFWTNVLLTIIAFAIVFISSFFVSSTYTTVLRITSVIFFLMGFFYYSFSLLRADNRFKLISIGVAGLSILSATLILAFAFFLPNRLVGAMLGLALAYGVIVAFWFLGGGYRYPFQVKGKAIQRCFVVGTPLLILGVFETVFISIDRWMISTFMDAEMLGYYALGIMASTMIGLVPGSISSVLYPKMLERFGSSGSEVTLRSIMVGPVRVMAAFISLMIGGGVLVLPVLIKFGLPKYLPSLPVLDILLPAAFFFASASIPSNLLVAINRQRILIIIQITSIVLALIFDAIVVYMGWGVIGIALSTAVVYAIYGGGFMVTAVSFIFDRRSDILMFLAKVYVLFVAMILGLVLATAFVPAGETLGAALLFTALRLVLFLVVLLPAVWWSNRNGDLSTIAREMFPKIFNKLRRR